MSLLTSICAELDAKRAKGTVYGVMLHPSTLKKVSDELLKPDPYYTPGDLISKIEDAPVYPSLRIRPGAFKVISNFKELKAIA